MPLPRVTDWQSLGRLGVTVTSVADSEADSESRVRAPSHRRRGRTDSDGAAAAAADRRLQVLELPPAVRAVVTVVPS